MRLFSATIATETNTFSPLPTSLDAFRESVWLRPGEHPDDAPRMCTAPLFVARKRAKQEGYTLIEGSCFAASPAGTVNRDAYEFMRDEVLDQLKAALPLDGVLFGLHGAMVAHGYDDVEGDILERARVIVGPDCVIGVELDPHCHLTLKRMKNADIVILYKEFPHTDVQDRAEDLLDLVLRTIRGEVKPVMSVYDCRQISSYPTTLPLMRGFVDRMFALEGKDGILSVSAAHCFPYGDVAELSGRILVVADGDKAKADALATKLGEEFVSMRGKTMPEYHSIASGVQQSIESNVSPVVMADPADNAGGGAPSDNTSILRELIAKDAQDAAVGPIWDPLAVRLCFDAGLGATFPLRFGGKIGPPRPWHRAGRHRDPGGAAHRAAGALRRAVDPQPALYRKRHRWRHARAEASGEAYIAQYRGAADRAGDLCLRLRHAGGGGPVLPGRRRAAGNPQLGQHHLAGPHLLPDRALEHPDPRRLPHPHRAGGEHAGRRSP